MVDFFELRPVSCILHPASRPVYRRSTCLCRLQTLILSLAEVTATGQLPSSPTLSSSSISCRTTSALFSSVTLAPAIASTAALKLSLASPFLPRAARQQPRLS